MPARRTVLIWAAGMLASAWQPAPMRAAVPARPGLYRVNGWLLTEADLLRLGPAAARHAVRVGAGSPSASSGICWPIPATSPRAGTPRLHNPPGMQ